MHASLIIIFFDKQMEIVTKRKRDDDDNSFRPHRRHQLTDSMLKHLEENRNKCTIAINKNENVRGVLHELELSTDHIHQHLLKALERHNTPAQLESVFKFLEKRQLSVLHGERPSADSLFSKIPFQNMNS